MDLKSQSLSVHRPFTTGWSMFDVEMTGVRDNVGTIAMYNQPKLAYITPLLDPQNLLKTTVLLTAGHAVSAGSGAGCGVGNKLASVVNEYHVKVRLPAPPSVMLTVSLTPPLSHKLLAALPSFQEVPFFR